eukprot:Hpha_TRINITY_DN26887_c0_g1::TRINITY_DN26887_c0_g1_i1::g.17319::m.17319/K15377/SLC44A2_4_5; solute carrier family 44 (choline transporter-like protein), member 2/4/5
MMEGLAEPLIPQDVGGGEGGEDPEAPPPDDSVSKRRSRGLSSATSPGGGSPDGSPGPTSVADEEVPESRLRPTPLVGKASRLEPKEHILITTGPCLYMVQDKPQTYHGGAFIRGADGNPFKDRHSIDPRSLCVHGPFRKPWLRVPKGGCLDPRLRKPSDRMAWHIHEAAFVIASFIAVYAIFFGGDPDLLAAGGVDLLGNVCGQGKGPYNPVLLKNGAGAEWEKMTYLWYPLDQSVGTAEVAMGLGLCVTECPGWDPECRTESCQASKVMYAWEQGLKDMNLGQCCGERSSSGARLNYCPLGSLDPREAMNTHCLRQFRITYPTAPLHKLCVPDSWNKEWLRENTTITQQTRIAAENLRSRMPLFTDSWFMFTADMVQTWVAAAASLLVCFICGEIYLYLIRVSPFWVPWASFAAFLVTAGLSCVALVVYNDNLQGHEGVNEEDLRKRHSGNLWTLVLGIVLTGVLASFMVFRIRKKMDLGSQLMLEANRGLSEIPGMGFVAPWVFLLQAILCVGAHFILSHVGTIHTTVNVENSWNTTYTDFGVTANLYHIQSTRLELAEIRGILLVYLIGLFSWTMGTVNAACYGITAHVCVHWYFSNPGDTKRPSRNAMSKAVSSMMKHLGSHSVGAILLTFVEPVRDLLDSLQKWLRNLLDRLGELHSIVRYLTCLLQVVLLLFDRFLKLVRRDAYVIQCIEGGSFVQSALRADELLKKHELKVRELAKVSDGVALCGRLSVLSCTCLVTVLMLTSTEIGKPADNLALIIFIGVSLSFFTSTMYGQIIHAAVDALILCFCYDIDAHDGSKKRPYFVHTALRELVEAHTEVPNDYRNIVGQGFSLSEGVYAATQLAKDAHRKIQDEAKLRQAQLEKGGKHIAHHTGKAARRTQSFARKTAALAQGGAEAAARAAAEGSIAAKGGFEKVKSQLDKAADNLLPETMPILRQSVTPYPGPMSQRRPSAPFASQSRRPSFPGFPPSRRPGRPSQQPSPAAFPPAPRRGSFQFGAPSTPKSPSSLT